MNFTDKGIKTLKPRANSYEVFSSDRTGFAIRISPTGIKTWFTRYRNRATGKQIKVTIGQYPNIPLKDARILHSEYRKLIHQGKDPRQLIQTSKSIERSAGTVEELVKEYIKRHSKKKKKSWQEDERSLHKDVIPNWGNQKVKDITRRQIISLLDSVVDRGSPISANNLHAKLSMLFKFAVRRGILDSSPFVEIDLPSKRITRDRVLNEDEITIFWNRLEDAKTHTRIKLALRLLLITGQRRGEVALAKLDEFDFKTRIWTIPSDRSKNNLSHRVPLSNLALEILHELIKLNDGSDWLLPSNYGDGDPFSDSAITRAVRNNLKHFGLDRFTPHDLRRTAASQMTALGVPRLVVSKILNHVETGITAVYDRHSYDDEKWEALTRWAKKIENLT